MEPERPIEKLLRAVAKKHREQAREPLELHAVAREELLREVSRRDERRSGGGFFASFFAALRRPRLALAICSLALLGVGAWLAMLRSYEKTESATFGSAPSELAMKSAERKKSPPAQASPAFQVAELPAGNRPIELRQGVKPAITTAPAPASPEANPTSLTLQPPSPNESAPGAAQPTVSSAPALPESPPEIAANRQPAPANDSFKQANVPEGAMTQGETSNPTVIASAQSASAPPATFAAAPPARLSAPLSDAEKEDASRRSAATANVGGVVNSTIPPMATNAISPLTTVAAAELEQQKSLDTPKAGTALRRNQPAMFGAAIASDRATTTRFTPVSQRFYRVTALSAAQERASGGEVGVSGGAPVLSSFQIVQNGPMLRVVDADGSVYTGTFQTTPFKDLPRRAAPAVKSSGAASMTSEAARAQRAKVESQTLSAPNYFFHVSGTNRNLKERIVFQGSFIPLTNALKTHMTADTVSGAVAAQNAVPNTVTPSWLMNSRIAGKVVIGDKQQIELDAAPTP